MAEQDIGVTIEGRMRIKETRKQFFKNTGKAIRRLESGRSMKVGEYEPVVQKEGVNEAFLWKDDGAPLIKEGNVYWRVQIDKNGQLDCQRQEDAFIISKLINIERMLKKR